MDNRKMVITQALLEAFQIMEHGLLKDMNAEFSKQAFSCYEEVDFDVLEIVFNRVTHSGATSLAHAQPKPCWEELASAGSNYAKDSKILQQGHPLTMHQLFYSSSQESLQNSKIFLDQPRFRVH
jgi:hypothetical protein